MSTLPAFQPLASRFRGLYHRVARRLGVDASYVSRVARGERRSEQISAALHHEVQCLLGATNHHLSQLSEGRAQLRDLELQLIRNSGTLLKTQLQTAWLLLESAELSGRFRYLDKAIRDYQSICRLRKTLRLNNSDYREIEKNLRELGSVLRQLRRTFKHVPADFDRRPHRKEPLTPAKDHQSSTSVKIDAVLDFPSKLSREVEQSLEAFSHKGE
jgi:transcriptional regulator with XRE-family HTH domain